MKRYQVLVMGFICCVIFALLFCRTRKETVNLPGGICWMSLSANLNTSRLMIGTNELVAGVILLKKHKPYVYGLCDDRVFILDTRMPHRGVTFEKGTYEISRKYGFKADLQGIRTYYDYKLESDNVDF